MIYRKRQAEMQAMRAEENRLKAAIAELQGNRKATAQADHTDYVRRGLGADILWQSWLDARQRELNIEMARLRARREPVEHRLRLAFGRERVAREIAEKAARQFAERRARKTTD